MNKSGLAIFSSATTFRLGHVLGMSHVWGSSNMQGALVPARAPFHNTITTIGKYGQSQLGKRAVTFFFLLQQMDSP